MSRKFNQRDYTHYVVLDGKITSGWSFKEDANEFKKDLDPAERKRARVLTKAVAKRQGIDPDVNASWGEPAWWTMPLKANGMRSLTHGVVPPYAEFHKHVTTWRDGSKGIRDGEEPVYKMELVGHDADCATEAAQDIPGVNVGTATHYAHKLGVTIDDVAALWAFVNALVHHADDAFDDSNDKEGEQYMDLASGIMSTLGYEWI